MPGTPTRVRTSSPMVAYRVDLLQNGRRWHWKVYRNLDTLVKLGSTDLDMTQALIQAGAVITKDKERLAENPASNLAEKLT